MAKNILIFADGTGQAGGLKPDQEISNVYKLFRATRIGPESPIDPAHQLAFYHQGLGTASEKKGIHFGWWDRIRTLAGAAAGLGISKNVADCYEAILRVYEPGDRIYLFGFSRGAYTARNVAGVLNLCGVPTQDGKGNPLPRSGRALRAIAVEAVTRVYDHGAGKPRKQYEPEREEQARRFRKKYKAGDDPNRGDVFPYFIGVFDAVAALGISAFQQVIIIMLWIAFCAALAAAIGWIGKVFWGFGFLPSFGVVLGAQAVIASAMFFLSTFKYIRGFPNKGNFHFHFARWSKKNYDGYLDQRINYIRHAMSIDETRKDFPRVQWGSSHFAQRAVNPGEPIQLAQVWFAGNHSDVGGSYPEEESRLSDISLRWMKEQATALPDPVIVDETRLHTFPDPAGMQHSEVESLREKYPSWLPWKLSWPTQARVVADEGELHPTVYERFALARVLQCGTWRPYRPEPLRTHPGVDQYYQGS
ncbi:T6SS phospholipase effector Tle1-like catalytic domain-containing protein [Rudaea cellulosilytica]|uniref:phospholipase effector Tle1 domain-containing protein n=1 Tax=Rudaea cellulosilytica TaxID=540746 RepID=UPI0003A30C24|nr:DUF2235 domain-containing protein [Rudaea cellulosilytica]